MNPTALTTIVVVAVLVIAILLAFAGSCKRENANINTAALPDYPRLPKYVGAPTRYGESNFIE